MDSAAEISLMSATSSSSDTATSLDQNAFYETYGSQYANDWPDDAIIDSGLDDTSRRAQEEEDCIIQILLPAKSVASVVPNDHNQTLEKIKCTVIQDDKSSLENLTPKPTTSHISLPADTNGYDSSDAWAIVDGPEHFPKRARDKWPTLAERLASTNAAIANMSASIQHIPDPYCPPVFEKDITVGVELEVIVTDFLPETVLQLWKRVAQTLAPLSRKLNTAVLVASSNLATQERHKYIQVHGDLSIRTEEDNDVRVGSQDWHTTNHPSAKGIEIATPILKSDEWKWAILEMAQTIHDSFKVAFNGTTGLHVHIGIGRDYQLQDLRRIAKAIVIFEEQMDKYHPECRNPTLPEMNSHILACRSSLLLKDLSNIEMMKKLDTAGDTDFLLAILQSVSVLDLYCPTPYHRGYRYNLTSVNNYNTVEFRQAIGTVDGHKIIDWVSRVIKFVTTAIATPDEVFNDWGVHGILSPAIYCRFGVPSPVYGNIHRQKHRNRFPNQQGFWIRRKCVLAGGKMDKSGQFRFTRG